MAKERYLSENPGIDDLGLSDDGSYKSFSDSDNESFVTALDDLDENRFQYFVNEESPSVAKNVSPPEQRASSTRVRKGVPSLQEMREGLQIMSRGAEIMASGVQKGAHTVASGVRSGAGKAAENIRDAAGTATVGMHAAATTITEAARSAAKATQKGASTVASGVQKGAHTVASGVRSVASKVAEGTNRMAEGVINAIPKEVRVGFDVMSAGAGLMAAGVAKGVNRRADKAAAGMQATSHAASSSNSKAPVDSGIEEQGTSGHTQRLATSRADSSGRSR